MSVPDDSTVVAAAVATNLVSSMIYDALPKLSLRMAVLAERLTPADTKGQVDILADVTEAVQAISTGEETRLSVFRMASGSLFVAVPQLIGLHWFVKLESMLVFRQAQSVAGGPNTGAWSRSISSIRAKWAPVSITDEDEMPRTVGSSPDVQQKAAHRGTPPGEHAQREATRLWLSLGERAQLAAWMVALHGSSRSSRTQVAYTLGISVAQLQSVLDYEVYPGLDIRSDPQLADVVALLAVSDTDRQRSQAQSQSEARQVMRREEARSPLMLLPMQSAPRA